MGYTAHELAELSGVSVRTLHYYEEQGLLRPERRDNGYRDYGPADVRRLQQILLFRRADMPLARIGRLLDAPDAVRLQALRDQLDDLRSQHRQLGALIATVEEMVREAQAPVGLGEPGVPGTPRRPGRPDVPDASVRFGAFGPTTRPEGRNPMSSKKSSTPAGGATPAPADAARFAALKQQAIRENEQSYGAEARARYGDAAVDATNAQVANMTQEQWNEAAALSEKIARLLAAIAQAADPAQGGSEEQALDLVLGETGRELCAAHKAWLLHYWTTQMYSPAAHRGLAQMYVADERFTATYEAMAPNGARILCDAIDAWADRLA